jgi:hypothetical protein
MHVASELPRRPSYLCKTYRWVAPHRSLPCVHDCQQRAEERAATDGKARSDLAGYWLKVQHSTGLAQSVPSATTDIGYDNI